MRHLICLVTLVNVVSVSALALVPNANFNLEPRSALKKHAAAVMEDYRTLLELKPEVVAQAAAHEALLEKAMGDVNRERELHGSELIQNPKIFNVIQRFDTHQLHMLAVQVGLSEALTNSDYMAHTYVLYAKFHVGCLNWSTPLGGYARLLFAADKKEDGIRERNLQFNAFLARKMNSELAEAILSSMSKRLHEQSEILEMMESSQAPENRERCEPRRKAINELVSDRPMLLFPTPLNWYF